jgi:hypothetical protein
MSTLLFNQTNNFSEMKISMNGVLFNRKSIDGSISNRAREVSFAGVFCFLVPMMFTFFCIAKDILLDAFGLYTFIMVSTGLMFRVIAHNWVSKLLSKQNSSVKIWQIMTFLVPSITLIVLGRLVRKQPSLFNMEKFGSIKSADETAIDYVYELDEQTFRRAI